MIVCLDLETSGLDYRLHEIIEIALVLFDEKTGEKVKTFSSLVRPLGEVSKEILALTHIQPQDLEKAPSLEQIRFEIQSFLGDYPLMGHNIAFDIGFLRENKFLFSPLHIDTFLIANALALPNFSLSLSSLCEYFGISLINAHRALADVEATILLFFALKGQVNSFSQQQKTLLHSIITFSQQSYLSDFLDISSQNLDLIGCIDSILSSFYIQVKKEVNPLFDSEVTRSYEDIITHFPQYSYRENQKKLYDILSATFAQDQKTLIEAPTGVGKTFGYIIPSILFALKNAQQVVISTKTKILQDQIYDLDIPMIKKCLGLDISVVKIKGKKNYISLYNFFRFLEKTPLSPVKLSFVLKIVFWMGRTELGELEELTFYGEEYEFLNEISLQSDDTLTQSNPYLHYEFYTRLVAKLSTAHIVITNHNFLLSDIEKPGTSLLGYKNIIIDEAHSLEDIATESLKISFGYTSFQIYLSRFSFSSLHKELIGEITTLIDQFETYLLFSLDIDKNNISPQSRGILIADDFHSEKLLVLQKTLCEKLDTLFEIVKQGYKGVYDDGAYIQTVQELLSSFLSPGRKEYIFFIGFSQKLGASLYRTYKHIGAYLDEKLWSRSKHISLLSATLSTGDTFDFITSSLNLHTFLFYKLESDFDYAKQVRIFVPDDLGDIKNNSLQTNTFFSRFIQVVKGKTMLLFTSVSSLKQSYLFLLDTIPDGVELLAQGINGGKLKILDTFKKHSESSILLGTESFWEGVDIPGESLSYLVIHKLPFPVPTDPIFVARSTLYQNAFEHYAVPKTILRLKQGFGRLIRSHEDKGVFIFLDNRIVTTKWGKSFFSSFPKESPFQSLSSQDLIKYIGETDLRNL